jgi:hypothetical protein
VVAAARVGNWPDDAKTSNASLDVRPGAERRRRSYASGVRRKTFLLVLLATIGAAGAQSAGARPAAGPTLSLSAATVPFGTSVVLKGTVPGAGEGQDVQVLSQGCGFTEPIPIATIKTGPGGAYSFTLEPMLNSQLSVQAGSAVSSPARVAVLPSLQLRRVNARTFAVDVSVGNGAFFTKTALLQRYDKAAKAWKTVASAPLKAASDPGALIAVSTATFRATVKAGTTLRAFVSQATVGECYRPAASPPLGA